MYFDHVVIFASFNFLKLKKTCLNFGQILGRIRKSLKKVLGEKKNGCRRTDVTLFISFIYWPVRSNNRTLIDYRNYEQDAWLKKHSYLDLYFKINSENKISLVWKQWVKHRVNEVVWVNQSHIWSDEKKSIGTNQDETKLRVMQPFAVIPISPVLCVLSQTSNYYFLSRSSL